jgi:hypothetical protein
VTDDFAGFFTSRSRATIGELGPELILGPAVVHPPPGIRPSVEILCPECGGPFPCEDCGS